MELTLNGKRVVAKPREGQSLLELLRDDLGLWSVKDGCAPEGSCGACTVWVDGHAVVSCAQKATRVEGKAVVTQEGLGDETRRLWAEAFAVAGASQCGFCSPGIVMKAEAYLAKHPEPSRAEIAHAFLGNLCRCTGYTKILDAVELVAATRRGEPVPTPVSDTTPRSNAGLRPAGVRHRVRHRGNGVGARAPRYEAADLALGDKQFVADLVEPGMLHGALRFSDHPRARVLRLDTSRAAAHPGVVAVVTAADVTGERAQGTITKDWRQLVAEGETTAYVGDVLAAVAAETRAAAREAAALVEVEYEVLEPVTDPFEAMADGASPLHAGGNVLSVSRVLRGDVDAALAGAAHVVSETFRTQFIEHAYLEPEAALVVPGPDGSYHVYSQGQGVWEDRRQIASFLDVPEEKVHVTQVATGGAFGGKEDLSVQCHAALLATRTRRPVLVSLSRKESLRFSTKRHPMWLEYTAGCDDEGHLLAIRARIVGDTGAYSSVGAKVLERAAGHACGAYRVSNVDVEATAVYTNNPPCGAMRGFGVSQSNFAVEGMLDRLATEVGLDEWEIRWRNALEAGDMFGTGQVLGPGVGLKQTLLAVRDVYHEELNAGIACCVKNTGIGNGMTERGRAVLRVEEDGSLTLFHSWTEMGQGVHTVLRQIVCEELGIEPERIRVVVDTEHDLDTGMTTASRATVLGGNAVMDAAHELRDSLCGRQLEELAGREFQGEFVVDWTTQNDAEDPVTHLAYAWGTQVAVLDDDGRLVKVVAAHDVGRALNPLLVEGQVEGGVHMGISQALAEEYVVEDGVPVTETLKSLHIVPPTGMPEVECILVEESQPEGPYGAKGVGEASLVPTAAAVAGALYAFDGVRRSRLPMKDSATAVAAVPHLVRAGGRS